MSSSEYPVYEPSWIPHRYRSYVLPPPPSPATSDTDLTAAGSSNGDRKSSDSGGSARKNDRSRGRVVRADDFRELTDEHRRELWKHMEHLAAEQTERDRVRREERRRLDVEYRHHLLNLQVALIAKMSADTVAEEQDESRTNYEFVDSAIAIGPYTTYDSDDLSAAVSGRQEKQQLTEADMIHDNDPQLFHRPLTLTMGEHQRYPDRRQQGNAPPRPRQKRYAADVDTDNQRTLQTVVEAAEAAAVSEKESYKLEDRNIGDLNWMADVDALDSEGNVRLKADEDGATDDSLKRPADTPDPREDDDDVRPAAAVDAQFVRMLTNGKFDSNRRPKRRARIDDDDIENRLENLQQLKQTPKPTKEELEAKAAKYAQEHDERGLPMTLSRWLLFENRTSTILLFVGSIVVVWIVVMPLSVCCIGGKSMMSSLTHNTSIRAAYEVMRCRDPGYAETKYFCQALDMDPPNYDQFLNLRHAYGIHGYAVRSATNYVNGKLMQAKALEKQG